ncbi:MAG: hypothetical protein EPO01_05685 [Aquabacterium sp.]|nr:MAG: hypothetical protein EPO12_04275 [Aquabacterium sp.]TAL24376.1 MAG: hypothetical protein EPO01_05685 [Aquabacterium sp.]
MARPREGGGAARRLAWDGRGRRGCERMRRRSSRSTL